MTNDKDPRVEILAKALWNESPYEHAKELMPEFEHKARKLLSCIKEAENGDG